MNCLDNIVQIDNVFSERHLKEIDTLVHRPKWEIAISEPGTSRVFWRMNLMKDELFTLKLFQQMLEIVGKKGTLQDVYLNGTTTSMASTVHIDSQESDIFVFLVFLNYEWRVEWGGQTIFINKYFHKTSNTFLGDNTTKTFYPRYNSGLLFPGNISHFAEAPTRYFEGLRVTLAYRFKEL